MYIFLSVNQMYSSGNWMKIFLLLFQTGWPRCATNHSKGHDPQVMKVALASRTKPLLIRLLSEHKAMWFLSVQPVCL